MITADTITDEQIRELAKRGHMIPDWRLSLEVHTTAPVALGEPGSARRCDDVGVFGVDPTPEQTRAARARCAEILNQRGSK